MAVCDVEQPKNRKWDLWRRNLMAGRDGADGARILDFAVFSHRDNASPNAMTEFRYRWTFPVLWLFISLVSTVDTYLTVKYQEHLLYMEINPIGRLLLWLDDWDPSLLIGYKFLGSTLVLGALVSLRIKKPQWSSIITAAIALFQFGLLVYLTAV